MVYFFKKYIFVLAALNSCLAILSPAFAQGDNEDIFVPPRLVLDKNNFDYNMGFTHDVSLLTIGDPANGGLSFSMRRSPRNGLQAPYPAAQNNPGVLWGDFWRFSSTGKTNHNGDVDEFGFPTDTFTAYLGFESITISADEASITPLPPVGHFGPGAVYGIDRIQGAGQRVWPAIDEEGELTGTFIHFTTTASETGYTYGDPFTMYHVDGRKLYFDNQKLQEIEFPNGIRHTYNYASGGLLQSITSSAEYMLHFQYVGGTNRLEKVTGINTSIYPCDPLALTCSDSQGANWPYVKLDVLNDSTTLGGILIRRIASVENRLGHKTTFQYTPSSVNSPIFSTNYNLTGIRSPQDPSVDDFSLVVSKPTSAQVKFDATINGQSWVYTVFDEGVNAGAVTGPEGYSTSWDAFQTSIPYSVYVTDIRQNGRAWTCDPNCVFGQDWLPVPNPPSPITHLNRKRFMAVTSPGGSRQELFYERGQLAQKTIFPEPASAEDLAQKSIEHKREFVDPDYTDSIATYVNWRNYNLPNKYTNPLQRVSDFDFNELHGGLESSKSPAPSLGAYASIRPEVRTAYANIGGGIVMPTEQSACAISASCDGQATETLTTFAYSAQNKQLETETVSAGDGSKSRTTRYTYTPLGDIATIDGPLQGAGDTTYRFYDDIRRLVAEVAPDPDGAGPELHQVVRYTYNADGNITVEDRGRVATPSNWNALTLSSQTKFYYDPYGRKIRDEIIKIGGAENGQIGALTQYNYDGRGRIKCVANRMNPDAFNTPPSDACTLGPEGAFGPDRITKTEYTVHSEIEKVIRALGTPLQQDYQTYTYYADGMMESVTDANGNKTTYEYDGFNRLSKTRFPSKTTPGSSSTTDYEAYTYDAAGNRKTLRKRDGRTIAYDYDNLNRLTRKDVPAPDRDVYYDYDLRDLEISALFDSASGPGLRHSYDALGQLTVATSDLTSTTLSYLYDAAGNRTRVTHPDGNYFTYDVDALSRPTFIRENGSAWLNQFTYDASARLSSVLHNNRLDWSVGYDDLSRVGSLAIDAVAGSSADVTETFNFNPVSQLTLVSRTNSAYSQLPSGAQDGAYVANGLNQYTSVDGSAFSYDGNGNLTSDGSTVYAYDVENRLVSMTPPGGGAVALKYDPYGRLYEVTGAAATRFVYDGDAMIQELDGANALLRRYVHGNGVDEPLVWYEGAGLADADRKHFARDRQGSIVAVAESATTAPDINAYTPFGVPDTSNMGRFSYTGQMVVPEIDLLYYKARIYSPQLGRFLQTDPIGYEDQQNLYAYVANDPMNATDPDGRQMVETNEGVIRAVVIPQKTRDKLARRHFSGSTTTGNNFTSALSNDRNIELLVSAVMEDARQAGTVFTETMADGTQRTIHEGARVGPIAQMFTSVGENGEDFARVVTQDASTLSDPTMLAQVAQEMADPAMVASIAGIQAAQVASGGEPFKVEVDAVITAHPIADEDRQNQ